MSYKKTKSNQTAKEAYARAVELISERGYHGTSLRTIAGAIGIQMSSLYYYFPSKQDLLMQIMRSTLTDLTAEVVAAVGGVHGTTARFEAGIRAHIEFHAKRRLEILITDSELRALEPENHRNVVQMRDRYGNIFVEILEAGCREGAFNVADTRIAMSALLMMCADVATWYRPEGRLTVSEIADQYVRLCMQGVGQH